jgi:hypothetical protein
MLALLQRRRSERTSACRLKRLAQDQDLGAVIIT